MDSPSSPNPASHPGAGPTPAAPAPATGWTALERIYCINLADRLDRRRCAQAEFARVGLSELVEFVVVERDPTDSERGIYDSHLRCLRAGLAAGAGAILIFEDDILFHGFSAQTLNDAVAFMRSGVEWDVLFLGCYVRSSRKTRFPSVVKIRYRCAAHAYVVSRRFAETLTQIPRRGLAYDDLIRSLASPRLYAVYPSFAFQNDSPSDNRKNARVHNFWRHFGGFRRLQQWDEFSHRHMALLILLQSAVLLLVLLLVLLATR